MRLVPREQQEVREVEWGDWYDAHNYRSSCFGEFREDNVAFYNYIYYAGFFSLKGYKRVVRIQIYHREK